MKWTDAKIEILKDSYAYSDLNELANQLKVTKKAVIRKAQKLQLYRAKNNQIIDGYKFCSFCQVEHPVHHFYRNKSKLDGLEYYCKKYYTLKKEKQNHSQTTPLLNQKRALETEIGASATENKNLLNLEYIKNRPKNQTLIVDGVEGKVCNLCKTFKALTYYSKDKNGIAGRKAICKSCYKERYSKRRA